jgi:hypothetical protein
MGATSVGMRMKRFYIPEKACFRVEAEQAYTQKVCAPALGAYASAVVS